MPGCHSSRVLAGFCFAFMTILMSGVNMFATALVMEVVFGWNISQAVCPNAQTRSIDTARVELALLLLRSRNAAEALLMPAHFLSELFPKSRRAGACNRPEHEPAVEFRRLERK
jgi:hypothetical protein